jgi:hypothetical protein
MNCGGQHRGPISPQRAKWNPASTPPFWLLSYVVLVGEIRRNKLTIERLQGRMKSRDDESPS